MSPAVSRSDRYDRSWAIRGAFLVETDQPTVVCPRCLATFHFPFRKAQHLRAVHAANVHKHTDAEGNELYRWSLPQVPPVKGCRCHCHDPVPVEERQDR